MPVTLRILCVHAPTEGVEFGLQDKNGVLQAGEPQPDGSLLYTCEVNAERVTGAFVHGKPGERFLYLSTRSPATGAWVQRIKVMLPDLADGTTLETTVDGRAVARVNAEWKLISA